MTLTRIVVLVAFCVVLNTLYSQQLDPNFKPSASYSGGSVLDLEKQPDGKVLVAGAFQTFDTTLQPFLLRINSNGTIDPSFNTGTGFNHRIVDILLQPDGKVLVLGSFTTFNGTPAKNLIRLNADGSRDNTFNTGSGFDRGPLCLALQGDGKILAAGFFVSFNGTYRRHVARLNADGSLDESLNIGPTGFEGGVPIHMEVQDDQKIIIGGYFTTINGLPKSGICRLNPNGTLDNLFVASGTVANSVVYDTKVLSSGKILVGGSFTSFNGVSKKSIVRLNSDGSLDNSFVASVEGGVFQIEVMPDNSIILSGILIKVNSVSAGSYIKVTEDGVIVSDFQLNKISSILSRTILQDGKLLMFGFEDTNFKTTVKLVRINDDGSLDDSFHQYAIFKQAGGVVTAVQSTGKLIVGGTIVLPDGTEKNHFLRLNRDGTFDNTFNIGTGPNSAITNILITPDDKIYASGLFLSFGQTGASRLVRLNADGSIDNSFAVSLSDFGTINGITLQPDGKIIVSGYFTSPYNGVPIKNVFRLNSNGTVDTSFDIGNGPNSSAAKTLVQPDGKIIVFGLFSEWNGAPALEIIRLLPNGSPDPSFSPGTGFDSAILTAVLDADGKIIVGGYFTSFNGLPAPYIVRLNTNGTRDVSFNPQFPGQTNPVSKLVIDKDNKILVGKYKYPFEEDYPTYLFRLTANGDLDNTFVFDGPNDGVEDIMIDIDERIIVSGAFTSVNGVPRNGMFAILPSLPAAPSDVDATLASATSIHITWQDHADNETGYIIERSLESPLSFTPVGTTLSNVLEYTDQDLEQGSTYIYRVAAVNSAGPSDFVNSNPVHVENITGLEEDKTKSVQIWKSATGEYTVQTQWANGFHLAVYDLMGRPVYSTESKSDELNFYPRIHRYGIYIFRIVSSGEVFTKKIAD